MDIHTDEDGSVYEYTISQSQLGEFEMCPERHRQAMREPRRIETDSTAVGTAVHAGIESVLIGAEADAYEVVADKLESLIAQPFFVWSKTQNKSTAHKWARNAMKAWFAEVQPQLGETLMVEERLRCTLAYIGDIPLVAEGTPDLAMNVDHGVVVVDWKTGREPQAWELDRWNLQGRYYSWLVKVALNLDYYPRFDFWYLNKTNHKGKATKFSVQTTDGHVDWFRLKALQVLDEYNLKGLEKPWLLRDSGWWCSPDWCPRWDTCKGDVLG